MTIVVLYRVVKSSVSRCPRRDGVAGACFEARVDEVFGFSGVAWKK